VKSPRTLSITLGILFLVPFCAIGVVAMILASSTVLPPGRVSDVRLSIGMQSGNAVLYNLDLTGGTGKTVTIPAFLRNKRDAERVAVMIKQTLASTHNLRTGQ
jgi:hypothetical protein